VPTAAFVLSGTPVEAGTFNFSIAVNNNGSSVVIPYRLQISAPTAASVLIAGRVTAHGRGLANATVYLTNQNGETLTRRTSSFCYYRFDDIPTGQTVILTVVSKRYQFAPRIVNVIEELNNLDFSW